MPRPRPRPRRAPTRLIAVLTTVWCLLPLMLVSGPAAGAPPARTVTPTAVVATLGTTQAGVGGAVPDVLAQAGVTPVTLTLTTVPAGSTFNKDATFALDASLTSGGTPAGTFTPGDVVLPARSASGTYTVTYSAVDNGVVLTPRMTTKPPKDFTTVPAAPFQSLKKVTFSQAGPDVTSVGTDVCGPDSTNSTDVACATVLLPHGTVSSRAVTTVGACTPDLGCPAGSEVVGFIADLGEDSDAPLYTEQSPAQIIIRCDASRCGSGGVNSYVVHMSFEATGPLDIVSQPCVAKGVARDVDGNPYCTDYVSSSRDGGDLLLVVLAVGDYRGAV